MSSLDLNKRANQEKITLKFLEKLKDRFKLKNALTNLRKHNPNVVGYFDIRPKNIAVIYLDKTDPDFE